MTEKRFTLKEIDNYNHGRWVSDIILDNGIELPQSTTCELLNKLTDETEQLKIKISDLRYDNKNLKTNLGSSNKERKELLKENEQLKSNIDIRDKGIIELKEENKELKQQIKKLEAQLYSPYDSICINCINEYLVQKDKYYVSKCKKGHEQCSKVDVKYCDDFELKGDV